MDDISPTKLYKKFVTIDNKLNEIHEVDDDFENIHNVQQNKNFTK